MDGIFSFLLFAGFFYFMMRVGCGSHAIHGQRHGKQQRDTRSMMNAIDPVCGKALSDEEGYGKMHDGNLYRFCSQKCLQTFESRPADFIKQPVKALDTDGGHEK